jgi:hypothetical protein
LAWNQDNGEYVSLQTAVSVSKHFKNPAQRVGLVQSGHHHHQHRHISSKLVFVMI